MKKPRPQATQINFVRSPDFKSYYCNNIKISITSNDIGLIFGLIMPPEEGLTTVEDQFILRLSPQSIKVLASSLNSTISGWQEIFGKLPEPPAGLSTDKGIAASLDGLKDKIKKLGETV